MKINKVISFAVVAIMLSVSFAVGVGVTVQAATDFMNFESVPWDADFTPNDIAWNDEGRVALVVGYNVSGTGFNAWAFDYQDNAWFGIEPPETRDQTMNGVCWDNVLNQFWLVGNSGALTSSVYSWTPGSNMSQDYPLLGDFLSVATDNWGNPMVVGNYDNMNYLWVNTSTWHVIPEFNTTELSTSTLKSIDFNWNDYRFYAVGDFGGSATMYYSNYTNESALDETIDVVYKDFSGEIAGLLYFNSIDWNQDANYGLVVGSAIYKLTKPVNITWTEIEAEENIDDVGPHLTYFTDVSWDTDGYTEAGLVGQRWEIGVGYYTYYWRYVPGNGGLQEPTELSQTFEALCVAFKPPSSPKFPLIPLAGGGGVIILAMDMTDQTTRITANAVFPQLYWIGFNDSGGASRLDQQVPLDSWYNFTCGFNYSQGFSNCEVEIWAWYDWGALGANSDYPAEIDGNRDLAFRLLYDVATTSYAIQYPGAGAAEIEINDAWDTITGNVGLEDIQYLEIPIYLGPQIRNATGLGWISGDDIGNDGETYKNLGLQDIWSWDFEIEVRDVLNPTALANMSAEFGIDETVSISVTGNPSGNAPPGTNDNVMSNPSQITYSANTDYWVNVSIPDLLINGVGPASILATDVNVTNSNVLSSTTFSDIDSNTWPTGRPFTGPGAIMCVWGNTSAAQIMPAPSNGTISFGEFGSDFNAVALAGGISTTQLDWWVSVPAGTAEGVYWAIITVTIDS